MRILLTGAGGQLGAAMSAVYAARADVVPLTRAELDIEDGAAVRAAVLSIRPDVVINCASFNDVDGAEERAEAAIRINALAVRAMAHSAATIDAVLVTFSTDFVFDGRTDRPYVETDPAKPQSVYASSKLLGEWFAADCPRHYVLRLESLFGGCRRGSVDRITEAIRKREPVRAFVDRTVTPSYVPDVIEATWALLANAAPWGVYHCVSSGVTTWFEMAAELARQLRVDADLVPVRFSDVHTVARRPRYAALSNARLVAAGVPLPAWQDALRRYLL